MDNGKVNRFFESGMEITGVEREIDDISDSRNKNGGTFFKLIKLKKLSGLLATTLKRGFQSMQRQRTQRIYELTNLRNYAHNATTSLLDRPITAASDDGVCRWHAAKLWQTCAKLFKLNFICIISCTTSTKRTKIWTIDLNRKF